MARARARVRVRSAPTCMLLTSCTDTTMSSACNIRRTCSVRDRHRPQHAAHRDGAYGVVGRVAGDVGRSDGHARHADAHHSHAVLEQHCRVERVGTWLGLGLELGLGLGLGLGSGWGSGSGSGEGQGLGSGPGLTRYRTFAEVSRHAHARLRRLLARLPPCDPQGVRLGGRSLQAKEGRWVPQPRLWLPHALQPGQAG
eukprot:scaffold36973_cov54-Phaeocystis_antarctica.AAC.5